MKVHTSAVNAMGLLVDAKSMLGFVDNVLSKSTKGSGRFGGFDNREGSVFRRNPSIDVNDLRALKASLRSDIEAIESGIFKFNGTFVVDEDGTTVALAMRRAKKAEESANEAFREATNSLSAMVIEGDDIDFPDVNPFVDAYLLAIADKRRAKNDIQHANGLFGGVEFEVNSAWMIQHIGATELPSE